MCVRIDFVAVFNPEHTILTGVHIGKQALFKVLHDVLFGFGIQVRLEEAETARGIGLLVRRAVNQLTDFGNIATEQLGMDTILIFPQQVLHRSTGFASATPEEFDDHGLSSAKAC